MTKQLDIRELLVRAPLFASLNRNWCEILANSAQVHRVLKNQFLYRRGDAATGIYLVAVGQIKASIPVPRSRHGKVIEMFGPGDSFGETLMLLNHPHIVDAQALDDSVVIWLDKRDIEQVLAIEAEFALQMLKNVSRRFETLLHDIETVSTHNASERVAEYLLKQPREGTQTQLKFSKCLIASRLGLQAESLSRALQRLSKDQLISVHGSHVEILNEQGLQQLNHTGH
ncbi:MAG: Crp/Fnr family transcriptional regulator [Alcaligenaceae bacterium]|jgi:CRP-like cAMP-binding protein